MLPAIARSECNAHENYLDTDVGHEEGHVLQAHKIDHIPILYLGIVCTAKS